MKFKGYVIDSLSPDSYICNLSMQMTNGNYIVTTLSTIGTFIYSICRKRSVSVNRFIQAGTEINVSIGKYYSLTHSAASLSNCKRCVCISVTGENNVTIECVIEYASSGTKSFSIDYPYMYISCICTNMCIIFDSNTMLGAYGISDCVSYTSYSSAILDIKLYDSISYRQLS